MVDLIVLWAEGSYDPEGSIVTGKAILNCSGCSGKNKRKRNQNAIKLFLMISRTCHSSPTGLIHQTEARIT